MTKPDILVLTDHGLKLNEISQFSINNYNLIESYCRPNYKSGGVAVYIRKTKLSGKPSEITSELIVEKDIAMVAIKVAKGKNAVIIVGIYRSHDKIWDNFAQNSALALEKLNEKFKRIIIAGDFNVDIRCSSL